MTISITLLFDNIYTNHISDNIEMGSLFGKDKK